MLGNPPWERIKLQEKEFFATRDRAIAEAPNKAARDRLITALVTEDALLAKRALGEEWARAKHASECEATFVRESGRYPLTATGDINTYAIFAETFLHATRSDGRTGFIVPTGIATDNTTRVFFADLVSKKRLISLFDFENREGVFPGVHRSYKFALVTVGASSGDPEFAFYLTRVEHLADTRRRSRLSGADIAMINPNTRTAPIFRSQADAQLTKSIHGRVPILVAERAQETKNPWTIDFGTMFHMANDSALFRTAEQLESQGMLRVKANWISSDQVEWVPLYEAKMVDQYDHRNSDYSSRGSERGHRVLPKLNDGEHEDPELSLIPHYWVALSDVNRALELRLTQGWLLGYGEATTAITDRTLVACVHPRVGIGHKTILCFFSNQQYLKIACLYANMNTIILDFVVRQKVNAWAVYI